MTIPKIEIDESDRSISGDRSKTKPVFSTPPDQQARPTIWVESKFAGPDNFPRTMLTVIAVFSALIIVLAPFGATIGDANRAAQGIRTSTDSSCPNCWICLTLALGALAICQRIDALADRPSQRPS
jgi:hypothetical protein